MDQPQDLHDFIRPEPIDDEVTRVADPACRFHPSTQMSDRIGENTCQARDLNRPDHTRLSTERGHGRQNQLAIPSSSFEAVATGAIEQDSVDLVFRRPGKPVGQSVAGGKPSPQPCHHAVVDALLVLGGRHRHVAAGRDIG